MIQVALQGIESVLGGLAKLEEKLAKKLLRSALMEASKVLLREVKSRVPQASGLLKKSLGRKLKTYRGTGVVVVIVGPRGGYKQDVSRYGGAARMANPTRYAHLVDRGTKRGATATRFVSGPASAMQNQLLQIVADELRAGLA